MRLGSYWAALLATCVLAVGCSSATRRPAHAGGDFVFEQQYDRAFGELGDEHGLRTSAVEWFVGHWDDAGPRLRRLVVEETLAPQHPLGASRALHVLGAAGHPADIALLGYLARTSPLESSMTPADAISALRASEAPAAEPELVHIVRVGPPAVARLAARALAQRGAPPNVYCDALQSREESLEDLISDKCKVAE